LEVLLLKYGNQINPENGKMINMLSYFLFHDIYIGNNAIQEKKLDTYESYSNSSYNFYGDKNAL